jgi:CTP synthase
MVLAAKYAWENKLPYLGRGLGLQFACLEFARDVLGFTDADSTEFAPESRHLVIDFMPEQKKIKKRGGTMRLGHYPCELAPGTIAGECYGEHLISERHRHRYEFNNNYRDNFEGHGVIFSGKSPDSRIIEIYELSRDLHPWFVGVQFHPEFKSRPNRPHPLFCGFVEAALAKHDGKLATNLP